MRRLLLRADAGATHARATMPALVLGVAMWLTAFVVACDGDRVETGLRCRFEAQAIASRA